MKKIIVIDFETTGFNPKADQIIEIAALKIENKNTTKYSTLVKSDIILSKKIIEITGINDEMLKKNGIDQKKAAKELFDFIGHEAILVGYNVMFDMGFLNVFFKKNIDMNFSFNYDVIDVLTIYRDHHKYPHKLSDAVSHYEISHRNTHRALDDVIATYEVLKALKKSNEIIIEKYKNIIGFNPKYGYRGIRPDNIKFLPQIGGMKLIEKKTS